MSLSLLDGRTVAYQRTCKQMREQTTKVGTVRKSVNTCIIVGRLYMEMQVFLFTNQSDNEKFMLILK